MDNFKCWLFEGTTKIFYRGIEGEYNKKYETSQNITWVTQSKEYAELYSDGKELLKYNIVVKSPFNFKYRTLQVHVKLKDILSRILVELNTLYGIKLNKKDAEAAYNYLETIEEKYSSKLNKMERVWEWWTTIPEIKTLLMMMNFDSIEAFEGSNNDVKTYGIFNKTQLKRIK